MKKIYLSLLNSDVLCSRFIGNGYSAEALNYPLSQIDVDIIKNCNTLYQSGCCVLIEIRNNDIENLEYLLKGFPDSIRIICISRLSNQKVKGLLLRNGICDLIQGDDPEGIITFIRSLNSERDEVNGKILVFDDNPVTIRIIKNIISRFDYETVYINNAESLFSLIDKSTFQLILLNLSTENLNLSKLIRSYYINARLKLIPVIAFKNMDTGLFVHEIVSGINRLTRVILSHEEMYSFLIDVLYRKKIIPLIKSLNRLVHYDSNSHYFTNTLARIYNTTGKEIFSMDNILDDNTVENILINTDLLKRAMIQVGSLTWLKITAEKNVNTCGVSGKN